MESSVIQRAGSGSDDRAVPASHAGSVDGVALGPGEHWILATVRGNGTFRFVVTLTAVVVLTSMGITLSALALTIGTAGEVMVPAAVLSAIVPAVVAPPSLIVMVRLISRLDAAGELLFLAALTDPLTGVLNRRGFFESVAEVDVAQRPCRIAMIDVDNFKQLNDTCGHAVGDLVLQRVADWLRSLAGDDGIVARMGGDEFVLLLADRERELPTRQSLVMDGVGFNITIGSVGVVSATGIDDALASADAALYVGKDSRTPT